MKNADAITAYCSHFAAQLDQLQNLQDRLYKKLLLVTMLDTLSRARFPNIDGNRERYITVIRTVWQEADRVSIPQLSYLLRQDPALAATPLAVDMSNRLGAWPFGRVVEVTAEPRAAEVLPLAVTPAERKAVERSTHADLFYAYRNYLVHEFREPGYPMEVIAGDVPYYMGMEHVDGRDRWELVYPMAFFLRQVTGALAELRRYLESNDLDPYSFYEFGTIWKR